MEKEQLVLIIIIILQQNKKINIMLNKFRKKLTN
jgi:hypothetical protein